MTASAPAGYQTVAPYLVVPDAAEFIDFLKNGLSATEIRRFPGEDGRIMHAEVRIGDCVIMMGDQRDGAKAWPAMLHLYVPDCDASYKRAIEAGATSEREPGDNPDGDRRGGVSDRWGNQWWFATPMKRTNSQG
jgi:uncharacterized glyoxalase superfamily protein PhnB